MTLHELIELVYPSSQRFGIGEARQWKQGEMELANGSKSTDCLLQAIGFAVSAGTIAAVVAMGLAIAYNRSLPPSPDFGGIRDDMTRAFGATIASSLFVGSISFVMSSLYYSALRAFSRKRIGYTWLALVAVLILVGTMTWFLGLCLLVMLVK